MTLKDGYSVNAWAAEPMIVQPMAFCWDDRGRLWVAENLDYETREVGFSNAGNSRILILEDTDRDGVADSRKVFMEGIVFPSAIAVGFDGVFVGAPPNLLFVPDRNGDDKADVADIEVRLTGWGIRDRHEVLNSLHWGPDGWLYGLQGYATSSKVRKPAGKGRLYKHNEPFPEDILKGEGVEINGGVWRYHPTKDEFEVVAHGFSNPWGIDYDAKGQLLISACVIPHLFHVIPGGIYHRQGGQHFNPYVYGDIQTIADHRHRSAHGGARVYQSDAFPQSQTGRIFMANIHEHAVLSDVLVRKGSGFTARHGDDFLHGEQRPVDRFQPGDRPRRGSLRPRLARQRHLRDGRAAQGDGTDLPDRAEAVARRAVRGPLRRLEQDDRRAARRAADEQERLARAPRPRDPAEPRREAHAEAGDARSSCARMFASGASPDVRLRAMWALHVTGGWTPDALVAGARAIRTSTFAPGRCSCCARIDRRPRSPSRSSAAWRVTTARRSCGCTSRPRFSAWTARPAGTSRVS